MVRIEVGGVTLSSSDISSSEPFLALIAAALWLYRWTRPPGHIQHSWTWPSGAESPRTTFIEPKLVPNTPNISELEPSMSPPGPSSNATGFRELESAEKQTASPLARSV